MGNDSYRILLSGGQGEYEEKKSRFIATVRSVQTEEEAVSFIEEMKKKYWDARHNCSAFCIGSRGELTRCSDDGEPSGTAGRPMLEVLLGSGVRNVAVVVTRYFGGVLLGTGGLVRAYTQAVKEGLAACEIGIMRQGTELLIEAEYNDIGKVLYLLGNRGVQPTNSEYAEKVRLTVTLAKEETEGFLKELTEGTAARVKTEKLGDVTFVQKEAAT
ncbi:MAG: YigZ family protein [Lachnospiraceae bacterium]|nr:YigZ family protein [Lachnospiraceae bacterium]MBR4605123.1 YigZ family protein [Lachnospiraceae bacterium]